MSTATGLEPWWVSLSAIDLIGLALSAGGIAIGVACLTALAIGKLVSLFRMAWGR